MKNIIIRRIIAFTIDWCLIFAISITLFFLGPRFDLNYFRYPSVEMFSAYGVILGILSFILLPLLKDCLFKNASFGKWLLRLKIVDKTTQNKPKIEKLLLRNITFYFPFIELAFLLFNKGDTIGDIITQTTVIHRNGKAVDSTVSR